MSTVSTLTTATRTPATPAAAQVRRSTPAALPVGPRLGFRVLQTSRAPAQLSLFLQPAVAKR